MFFPIDEQRSTEVSSGLTSTLLARRGNLMSVKATFEKGYRVEEGDSLYVPPDTEHSMTALEEYRSVILNSVSSTTSESMAAIERITSQLSSITEQISILMERIRDPSEASQRIMERITHISEKITNQTTAVNQSTSSVSQISSRRYGM
jgi:ribosomal protein L16 Arg81 hydroxylase